MSALAVKPNPLTSTLLALSLGVWATCTSAPAWAHGGTPRVLSIHRAGPQLTVLDTLGLFEVPLVEGLSAPPPPIERSAWRWLCDDAVDMMAGVDAATRLSDRLILAVSRSGVYRSEDNGCTFSPLGEPLSLHSVPHLSAHPDRAQEVAVASHTLGRENDVFVSLDGGVSWRAAGLNINGGIYALWRNPNAPDELWVSHAEGLSVSIDGGLRFSEASLETQAGLELSAEESATLVARPQALKLLGGGQVSAGPLSGQRLMWMSVNLYPDSTLLRKVGDEPWEPVHQVADSYNALALSGETVVVSTTFEGVFRRTLSTREQPWQRQPELMIGCLYASQGELWGCGRGDDRAWLVGVSLDEGERWDPVWERYSDAAGASWSCPEGSPAALACEARCLEEGCDPSGLVGGASGAGVMGEVDSGVSGAEDTELMSAPTSGGCQQNSAPWGALWLLFTLAIAAQGGLRRLWGERP